MIKTACGLDCPDACGMVVDRNHFPKVVADPAHPTSNGALCALLNKHLFEEPRITTPRLHGKEVSMPEALDAVAQALQVDTKLLWRGSGNFGVMQEVTNLLFDAIGGTTTHGSLCDGAGDAGILEGRGVNRILPPETIAQSEVVVVWGKNITVTASHLMPYLEGKKIIVIDPIATPIAKQADLFVQISPRTDFFVAIMLARFAFMGDHEDLDFLQTFASDAEEFYDFTREFRIRPILEYIGIDLYILGDLLEMIAGKKTVYLVGNGVQKYSTGHHVLHAIDSLAMTLGHFGKEGCGVGFLGNSKLNLTNPFDVKTPTVPKATTPFEQFKTVLIQGGNPAASMPNSNRVIQSLQKTETVIYFGLYENETSALANIIIPAQNFFEKEDLRLSYAHHYVTPMKKVMEPTYGISEHAFTQAILQRLQHPPIQSEAYYLEFFLNQCEKVGDYYRSPAHQAIPYHEGFGEDGEDIFELIQEYEDDFIKLKEFTRARRRSKKERIISDYWLVTPKSPKSLNTQFKRDNRITLHPHLGFREGAPVRVLSDYGSVELIVQHDPTMRQDTVLIPVNTLGVNRLTPDILSEEGEGATYQEVKVTLESI